MRRSRTEDFATPRPNPSGGLVPRLALSSTALHFPPPPLWIPACAGMTNSVMGNEPQIGEVS